MKKVVLAMLLFAFMAVHAQHYVFHVDLTACKNNRLPVILDVPELNRDTLLYQFPTSIPGSYMVKDYGSFIKGLKATEQAGKKLRVQYNKKENNFRIFNAKQLAHIEYVVEGTWISNNKKDYIFQPGGTDFELNTFYILNTHALFGFFEGYEKIPFELNIHKNAGLFCASSASVQALSDVADKVELPDYATLIDNPLMYAHPDTVSLKVKNCTFHIAVYSRTGAVTAASVLEIMKPVLETSMARFFPVFPTDNYCFSFFFHGPNDDRISRYGGVGALEHSRSSFYFGYETRDKDQLKRFVTHVTSHEFLHVLTPLSLKSERVYNYNFKTPVMSKHLWMYEGSVEYFSALTNMQDSILTEKEFIENIRDKVIYSNHYPNISMIEFGEKICENKDENVYRNVYNRGALVAFLMDIRMNELTNGEQNLKKVIFALNEKYKGSFFKEDNLIPELISRTHPLLKGMIDSLVVGNYPLPVEQYLGKLGYKFYPEKADSMYTYGDWAVRFDTSRNKCIVLNTQPNYNVFSISSGDYLESVDSVEVNETNYSKHIDLLENPVDKKRLEVVFEHYGQRYKSHGYPIRIPVTFRCLIEPDKNATEAQLKLRQLVFGK